MYNKNKEGVELSPTDYQKEFMKTFEKVVEECKTHLANVKDSIQKNMSWNMEI